MSTAPADSPPRPASGQLPGRRHGDSRAKPVSKPVLLLLVLLFGWCGGHRYYLKRYAIGILETLFFWTLIPAVASLVELAIFATCSEAELRRYYPDTASASSIGASLAAAVVTVIVLTAMLAAVVLPRYQRYIYRDRVASALAATAPLRRAVAVYWATHHAWPDRIEDLGPVMAADNPFVASVTVLGDGRIRVSFSDRAGHIAGETVLLVPKARTGTVPAFICGGGTLDPRYYPTSCRDG